MFDNLCSLTFHCVQKPRVNNDVNRRTQQEEHTKPDSSRDVDRDSTSGVQHVSHEDLLNPESTNGAESADDLDSSELHLILSSSSSLSSSDAGDSVSEAEVAEADMAVESSDESAESVDDASNDNDLPSTDIPHDDGGSRASTLPETERSVLPQIV